MAVKKLLGYMRPYIKECIFGPLLKLAEATLELLVPLVMAAVIDRGIAGADKPYIYRMCLLLAGLGIAGLIFSVTAQYFAAKAAVGFVARLRQALFGETECIEVDPHPLNQPGTASGRLAGGNLTVIRSADGTPEELTAEEPTVLLIEEVGEFVYRIDRIMQSLARSGKLENLRAVVVGHFSEMLGMEKFGVADACAIISSYTRPLGIPVVFGFPAGHEAPNLAVYLGRRVTVSVDEEGARMEFAPAD